MMPAIVFQQPASHFFLEKISYTLTGLFKIRGLQIVFFHEVIEIGAVFSSPFCGLAHIPLADVQQIAKVFLFKGVLGFFERLQGF